LVTTGLASSSLSESLLSSLESSALSELAESSESSSLLLSSEESDEELSSEVSTSCFLATPFVFPLTGFATFSSSDSSSEDSDSLELADGLGDGALTAFDFLLLTLVFDSLTAFAGTTGVY